MKRLTPGEEEVMQVVWRLGEGSAGQVREALAESGTEAKPTTVSTVLRVLVDKGFLTYRAFGRTYVYAPAVPRAEYSAGRLNSFIGRFFGGSPARLVSFLAERESLSLKRIEELLNAADSDEDNADDASNSPANKPN